jgi:hypothetical protein
VQSLVVKLEAPLLPAERADFETTAADLKRALGEAGYREAFEAGKKLTLDEAVELTRARVKS